jgi:hypothetical protein
MKEQHQFEKSKFRTITSEQSLCSKYRGGLGLGHDSWSLGFALVFGLCLSSWSLVFGRSNICEVAEKSRVPEDPTMPPAVLGRVLIECKWGCTYDNQLFRLRVKRKQSKPKHNTTQQHNKNTTQHKQSTTHQNETKHNTTEQNTTQQTNNNAKQYTTKQSKAQRN